MGDPPYIRSEQGGLIYEYTLYKHLIPTRGLIICSLYHVKYTYTSPGLPVQNKTKVITPVLFCTGKPGDEATHCVCGSYLGAAMWQNLTPSSLQSCGNI